MGGFKEGSVSGWETEEDDADDEAPADVPNDDISTLDGVESDSTPDSTDTPSPPVESEQGEGSTPGSGSIGSTSSTGIETADIPWLLRRNSITDGREQTVQLHLQEQTLDLQREQKTRVEAELGEGVRKADLREAALLVGLQQLDDVADVLREWGYALE